MRSMWIKRTVTGTLILAFAATIVAQLPPVDVRDLDDAPEAPGLPPGLWPSPAMIERGLGRMAGRVAERYALDEEQSARLSEMLLTRWPKFFNENKTEIQSVMGEVVRGRLRGGPPPLDEVQRFGNRVLPLFEKLRQNVEAAAGEFRGILRPEQTRQFDDEFAMAREGLKLARGAIQDMRQGIFDPPEWQRRAREAGLGPGGPDAWRRRRAEREDEGPRLTSWERYVASFVRRYRLDEGQETTALAILQDLQARRSEHEHRTAAQLDRLEQRLAQTDDAEARAALQEQRTALNQPIEQMADDLHRRLRALLTSSQRQADRERQRPTQTNETLEGVEDNLPTIPGR